MIWAIGLLSVLAIVIFHSVFVIWLNRHTCEKAFQRGALEASLPFSEIIGHYEEYLSPMRPMDAAAYQQGLAYAVAGGELEPDQVKAEFMTVWKWGLLTDVGTHIRRMGAEKARERFILYSPKG